MVNRICLLVGCLLIVGGCTMQRNWDIETKKGLHRVHLAAYEGIAGPNMTTMFLELPDGTLKPLYSANGTGLAPAMVSGGSQVGAAYLFGHSLRPDQYRNTTNVNQGQGQQQQQGQGGDGPPFGNGGGVGP